MVGIHVDILSLRIAGMSYSKGIRPRIIRIGRDWVFSGEFLGFSGFYFSARFSFWHIVTSKTRWCFQIFVYFHPYLGKWSNFTNIFSNGLKQPTRKNVLFPTGIFVKQPGNCESPSPNSTSSDPRSRWIRHITAIPRLAVNQMSKRYVTRKPQDWSEGPTIFTGKLRV